MYSPTVADRCRIAIACRDNRSSLMTLRAASVAVSVLALPAAQVATGSLTGTITDKDGHSGRDRDRHRQHQPTDDHDQFPGPVSARRAGRWSVPYRSPAIRTRDAD